MKNSVRIVAMISMLLSASASLFAQNLSPYEQKRYDLAAQTATEIIMEVPDLVIMLGMSVKQSDFANKYEEMDFFEGLIQTVGVSAVYTSNSDYQSFRVKEIYRIWTEKRRQLDKTRTKADEQREQARRNQTENSLPPRGTKALLLHSIKKDFEKWVVKGEFEKTDELLERMRVYGPHIFDSICYLYTCGKWSVALSTEAADIELKYNADEEVYTMTFSYGDKNNTKTVLGKAPVPISFARNQKADNIVISSLRIVHGMVIPDEIQVSFFSHHSPSQQYAGNIAYMMDGGTNDEYVAVFRFDSIPGEKPLNVCFSEIGYEGKVPIELLSHCMNPNEYLKALKRDAFVKDSVAKRKRFVRDSIEKRERFVKDSIEKRQRFVRDSIAQRERFVIDSIKNRNREIQESNYRYSTWLESFEQYVEHSYLPYIGDIYKLTNTDGKVKKCSFDGDVLTLKCGKKTYSGMFSAKNVKTDMGEVYRQDNGRRSETRNVVANEDGTLVIYRFATIVYDFVILIDRNNVEVYEISDSVKKKLKNAKLIK